MLFCNCNMCAGTSNTCHCVVAQQKRLAHDEELKEKKFDSGQIYHRPRVQIGFLAPQSDPLISAEETKTSAMRENSLHV